MRRGESPASFFMGGRGVAGRGWRAYVPILFLTEAASSAIRWCRPVPIEGPLARRRSVGTGTVLWCGLASFTDRRPKLWAGGRNRSQAPVEQTDPALGGHRAGLACPPKQAVCEEALRLFHSHHPSSSRAAIRATLDCLQGSEPKRLLSPQGHAFLAGISVQSFIGRGFGMSRSRFSPAPLPFMISRQRRPSLRGGMRAGLYSPASSASFSG
jgi:hypothetical protein